VTRFLLEAIIGVRLEDLVELRNIAQNSVLMKTPAIFLRAKPNHVSNSYGLRNANNSIYIGLKTFCLRNLQSATKRNIPSKLNIRRRWFKRLFHVGWSRNFSTFTRYFFQTTEPCECVLISRSLDRYYFPVKFQQQPTHVYRRL